MKRSRVTRAQLILCAVVALGWVLLPGPAWAHATLVSSQPADGERLERLPETLSLTFSDDMLALASVVVTGPDGSSIAVGEPTVTGVTVSQQVAPGGVGQYVLAYRATSVDGHPLTGQIGFAVGEAAVPLTASASATSDAPAADSGGASAPNTPSTPSARPEAGGGAGLAVLWQRDVLVPLALFAGALALWSLSRRTARLR